MTGTTATVFLLTGPAEHEFPPPMSVMTATLLLLTGPAEHVSTTHDRYDCYSSFTCFGAKAP